MLLDTVESSLRTHFTDNQASFTDTAGLIVVAGNTDPVTGVVRINSEWCVLQLVSLRVEHVGAGPRRRYHAQLQHRIRVPLDGGVARSMLIQKDVINLWDAAYTNGLDTNIRLSGAPSPRFGNPDQRYPGFWLDLVVLPIWYHHTPS